MKETKPVKQTTATTKQSQFEISGYTSEVNKVAPLTMEQEISLGNSISKNRCPVARAQLMRANLRLVIPIASKFSRRGASVQALIEEGNTGLAWAVEEFDPNQGVRFSTFASWWIKHAIRRVVLECEGSSKSIAS